MLENRIHWAKPRVNVKIIGRHHYDLVLSGTWSLLNSRTSVFTLKQSEIIYVLSWNILIEKFTHSELTCI